MAVVTAGTREPLRRCLGSLAGDARSGLAEVCVVDNGRGDDAEMARREFPWATIHGPGENLGYGRAVNLVAERTRSPWLVAANSDVELPPGGLEALMAAGEATPEAGAVAPRLLLPGGRTQHSAYPFPTLGFTLLFNLGVLGLSARAADRMCLEGRWNGECRRVVPWAVAACLLVRRAAFEDVGGFDPRQWMYAEDLDLGWRLHHAGWSTLYEPGVTVRHEGSVTTTVAFGADRPERQQAATYEWMLRRRGRLRTAAVAAINVAGAAARVALYTALSRAAPERFGAVRDSNRAWLGRHRRGLRSVTATARGERRRAQDRGPWRSR